MAVEAVGRVRAAALARKMGRDAIRQPQSVEMMEAGATTVAVKEGRNERRNLRFRTTNRSRSEDDGREGGVDDELHGTDDNHGAREGAGIGDDEAGGGRGVGWP